MLRRYPKVVIKSEMLIRLAVVLLTGYLCTGFVFRGRLAPKLLKISSIQGDDAFGFDIEAIKGVKSGLIGRYSNKVQADEDHALGKMTGAQGGHEFVTACITEHTSLENFLVATYYYGEDKTAVFRHRLYELCSMNEHPCLALTSCRMRLYRPTLEHTKELNNTQYLAIRNKVAPELGNFEYLQGCDVVWKREEDAYEGNLIEGECVICSQQDPMRVVKVRDDLRLTADELWINDRVYTIDGKMIIGNVAGVPYKLKKVGEC